MRILYVHERFGAFGGAEANILATANELKKRGHAVGILHGARTSKGESSWQNVFDVCLPLNDESGIQPGEPEHSSATPAIRNPPFAIRDSVAGFAADLLYIHKLSDLAALEQLLDSGIPVIRMVHDHDLYCMRSYKYNYFTRRICHRGLSPYCVFPCGAFVGRNRRGGWPLRWVSYREKKHELELNRRCHRLVVATPFMKDELLRNRFHPSQIAIHAPVPPAADPALKSSFSDRNYIVYAGQLVRGKGVDVLLESLAEVRVPFTCFIFGDGGHRDYCERMSRNLGLAERVRFKGYLAPEELARCYRDCSLVAVSSVWPEPFGAVGLEAMQYGLPVVAFDAGGIRTWLRDGLNGFLVPWMDRAAFGARVEQLLTDKALARQMGERGRRIAAGQYAFKDYVNHLEQLFERVAQIPALAACA